MRRGGDDREKAIIDKRLALAAAEPSCLGIGYRF
jgi:hypothetical protein